ncbi:Tripartite tricarboxylate transporter family receptor [Pigmentiphaga humi]|uniref:Tripartite tricarboxylate transporter family receptor n=1 Tax=Pigmentiphaga humi TaxID=2478468 RepID=A0A3P4AYW3_9BURK|nr:tripartite tricarboxylate transporter substrate binding protein [Pigmentiphaga humi]VCU68962.1 Tripartite tricarboxylate transporter family receptor [Pigmentiphaga humi]
MNIRISFALKTLAATVLASALGTPALAQSYPTRPVRLIVPYAAGGGSDVFARTVAPAMSADLGQPIVVENKPGAATAIGADLVAKAAPDGYTVLLGDNATYAVNPSLYPNLAYDPQKDLAPVSLTARFALVLVVGSQVPVASVAELTAYAKKSNLFYASPGTGSPHHLAMEMFRRGMNIPMTHVPYKGSAPATNDLLAGTIPTMFLDLASASQHLKAGKLRALAVSTPQRLKDWPDIPTVAESGLPGYEAWAWQGLSVPAATPAAIVERLNKAYAKAASDPATRQRITDQGAEILSSTPNEMGAYVKSETATWSRLIREANIKVE